MTSDSNDPTRRKHCRSLSDEDNNDSENPSKRRKHHRHHRHHKHHHHRHRHHNRSSKKEDKVEDLVEPGAEIEETRIDVKDDGGASDVITPGSILGIDYDDMEEGEIVEEDEVKKEELDSDHSNMAEDASQSRKKPDSCLPSEESMDEENGKSGGVGKLRMGRKDDKNLVIEKRNDFNLERTSKVEHVINGEVMREYRKDDLYHEECNRKTEDYNGESILRDKRYEMLVEDGRKKHRGLSSSPSQDTHHDRARSRSRPKSPDRSRGRSRSQSVFHEGSLPDTSKAHDDAYNSKRKHRSDSDDERVIESSRDYKGASKYLLRDKEREHSSYSRYSTRGDRHLSRETWDRDREGSRDVDRERTREKDRDREKVRDQERERARERERERERHRDWEGEKERERRRERDRESSRDRNRDRDGEKYFRHSRYNDDGELDRYNNYRRRWHDDAGSKDRLRESNSENIDSSKANFPERESENSRRDENEPEDYQEKVVLQLAEQEEDDLEKIKEESRRRREAILEKYQSQQQQQQPEHTVKDQIEQPSLMVVSEITDGRNDVPDDYDADSSFSVGKSPPPNGISAFEKPSDTGGLGAGTPKSERSVDMFCDDIFGESPAGVRKTGKGDGLAIERSGLHDNWDDPEGYYSYRFGEILDGRYEIIAAHGKGVFSSVVRAKDLKAKTGDPEEVAIKIIRNNETMYKAGMEELVILKKLVGADPENKRHCVRFLSSFKYRNHLCLVFESLHMNLREVLKKFGRNIGLRLTAVRAYAKQLFIALKHLKNCGVLHCDIKPDNMLVNEAKNVLKLCDFGNAMFAGKNEVTPYLVSRFYRSPEIILGLSYDHPMDMWSVGCCLFELYNGKVLFPGPTNNDMLRLQMELKGSFPKKMVRKGAFKDQHFDQGLNFLATEEDPVTKKAVRRAILNVKPKDFGTLIPGSPGEDPKMLANFKDLLEKIFMLDPDKRITVAQALSHPFITGK